MSSIIPLDYLSHFSLYYFGCIEFGWYVQRTLHSPVPFTEWHSVFSRTIETGMHVTCIMATSQCPTCNALIIPNEWKFLLQLYNTHNHQISRWMFPSDIFRLLFFLLSFFCCFCIFSLIETKLEFVRDWLLLAFILTCFVGISIFVLLSVSNWMPSESYAYFLSILTNPIALNKAALLCEIRARR